MRERKNVAHPPPVANVTQMAVVIATASPRPNLYLLDKLIASAEYAAVRPLICWNKTDLEDGGALAAVCMRRLALTRSVSVQKPGGTVENLRGKAEG